MLFGGPAGAGKSTLAAAWCASRARAVHIQLDEVRSLIVSGRADPQQPNPLQTEQYILSVSSCCALARVFLHAGYDVAIDDTLPPDAFERHWQLHLVGLDYRVVIVLPSLDETLARAARRKKRVLEEHTRSQHAAYHLWPERYHIDTTGLTVAESLALAHRLIEHEHPPQAP